MKKIDCYEGSPGDNIEWCLHYLLLERDMRIRRGESPDMVFIFNDVALWIDKSSTYANLRHEYQVKLDALCQR